MKIPVVLHEIIEYGIALGMKDLNKLPGCWEQQVDEQWWLALNAHSKPTECSSGVTVPPFSAYLQFNGWPAGIVDAGGGTMAAGRIANEDILVEALRSARQRIA